MASGDELVQHAMFSISQFMNVERYNSFHNGLMKLEINHTRNLIARGRDRNFEYILLRSHARSE